MREPGIILTEGLVLGLFFVQRYRFLTIDQSRVLQECTGTPPPVSFATWSFGECSRAASLPLSYTITGDVTTIDPHGGRPEKLGRGLRTGRQLRGSGDRELRVVGVQVGQTRCMMRIKRWVALRKGGSHER